MTLLATTVGHRLAELESTVQVVSVTTILLLAIILVIVSRDKR